MRIVKPTRADVDAVRKATGQPLRAQFRGSPSAEALALDPGGSGLIASAIRGTQPSPQAFGGWFDCPDPLGFDPEQLLDGGLAVLCLSGPLEHHASWLWHSYEDLAAVMAEALSHEMVRALILKVDSPGGVAAGMGEMHRAIRRMSKRTGKPVYAYADELAASAAYHLSSACTEIWLPESGHVGSVGVILCTIDETVRLEKEGIAVRYLVTGARKADLHPGQPVTEEVLDVAQQKVDKLGTFFFNAVAKARDGTPLDTPAAVEKLQAAVYIGQDAVDVGLADGVAGWETFLGMVRESLTPGLGRATEGQAAGARTMPRKARAARDRLHLLALA